MASQAVRRKTRIVCISDTHNNTPKLPPGDVLIHAGDLTNQGSYDELERSVGWLEKAPFEVKIVVAGSLVMQYLVESDLTVMQATMRLHLMSNSTKRRAAVGNGLRGRAPGDA
jgi:predicted phosphodiesterase